MEKRIRVLIVDDEDAPRHKLRQLIGGYSKSFEVAGEANNALSGLKQIVKLNPDLLILDVEMPGGNGFELLDCLSRKDISVIFCSEQKQYAIQAFRYNALDYILKPIDVELLFTALEKARNKICREILIQHRPDAPLKLAIHSQNEIEYIKLSSIVRLEGSGCYTYICLENGRQITVSKALGEYECQLLDENFIRVHKSHVINIDHVRKFVRKDGLMVKMTDDCAVPIAVRRRDIFEQRLKAVAI